MKRIAIQDETHRLIRIVAATDGKTLMDVVDEAIREYMERRNHPDFAHVRADSDPVAED